MRVIHGKMFYGESTYDSEPHDYVRKDDADARIRELERGLERNEFYNHGTIPCSCKYECCQENLPSNTMVAMGGAYCKKQKGELKERKMRPMQREQLDAAHNRLSRAASALRKAQSDLDAAEREHRIASELVDTWERITDNPDSNADKT